MFRRRFSTVVMCLTAGLAGIFVQPAGAAPAARASYIVVLRDDVPILGPSPSSMPVTTAPRSASCTSRP